MSSGAPSHDLEPRPVSARTNYISNLQYVTTGGAVLLFLRAFNRFISHRQRGQALVGSATCLYLTVANEFGLFPFNFFVAGKVSTSEPAADQ
ncbi:unnamed protein product, partial [Mesorhabditis spiculigera]